MHTRTLVRRIAAGTPLVLAAAAAFVLSAPAASAHASWEDSSPFGGQASTGQLRFADDSITGGEWTDTDGAAFDSASDTLTAGQALSYTVSDVGVVAVGDNLSAHIEYASGAVVPEGIRDHISLAITTDPTTIAGASADSSGTQSVDLTVTLTADDGLNAAGTIDLSHLAVTLTNGASWTDTAALNAGTLTTAPLAPGGTVILRFDPAVEDDDIVGFYLDNPRPGTTIAWGIWNTAGTELETKAVDGLNSMDFSASPGANRDVKITGAFDGFGSAEQTESLIGSLTHVEGWTDDIGSTSAAYAFANATHLVSVSSMPSGITDASYAFHNAGSKATYALAIQNWDTANVTTMAHMFDGATSFNSWDIGSWKTANVTDMSYMFAGATSYSTPLYSWDTSRVTTMEGMFAGATAFTGDWWGNSIGLWNVSAVTNMDRMFTGAAVFNADLSGWNVSAVTSHVDFATGAALAPEHTPVWNDATESDRSRRSQPRADPAPTVPPAESTTDPIEAPKDDDGSDPDAGESTDPDADEPIDPDAGESTNPSPPASNDDAEATS
ncbi:BspA family leucine-rich repeat surface protein [Paramicrobacterium fandaimingii]|uniref:BspA family leucine-rich repeat surface protein n=1 Tax=Paramicrobacterium fandaimingii TaxID=2708079 RepID=UPI001422F26D|nr:BspA family leucine-rich repeat surface protein [Microbacterium fandaimingii]